MTRKWIGRTAVRLYPPDVRAAHCEELVGTMLDAGDYSLFAFVRHLVSLIVAGLLARSRDVLSQPLGRLASDMVRWAAVMTIGRVFAGVVVEQVRWGESIGWAPATIWIRFLGPALVLALFISRRDRATGIVGLLWCLVYALHTHPPLQPATLIYVLALPIVGCALLTIAPRRGLDPGRALVLVPLIPWAFFLWAFLDWHSVGLFLWQSGVGYLLPVAAAGLFVTVKPALALATALSSSLLAASYLTSSILAAERVTVLSIELLGGAAIVLALTALSRRALTRT